jgi:hypothetical protein
MQVELLGAFRLQLYKTKVDTSNPLRFIEKKTNGLLSRLSSSPAAVVFFVKRGFDRKSPIL